MLTETLLKLFERDLEALKTEIQAYSAEAALWKVQGTIKNSAGNLALHLVGNLQHFIGAVLGNTCYIRNRDYEFSATDVPSQQLLQELDTTLEAIRKILPSLSESELKADFPINVFGHPMSTEFFLIHLGGHLNYHLGQVNYHRRLLDAN